MHNSHNQRLKYSKMAPSGIKDSPAWCSKHMNKQSNCLSLSTYVPFKLDRSLLAEKSATIASLLESNPYEDISAFIKEIPLEAKALELVARFCHGLEVKMTSDNILSLICLSHYLKMTDAHSSNNLLSNALFFLREKILSSWDLTIRSLRAISRPTFQQAVEIGLLDICVDALTTHAICYPTLLGVPFTVEYNSNRNRLTNNGNGTRRKLFADVDNSSTSSESDTALEEVTSLPVEIYEPIIKGMLHGKVQQEYITGSLHRYFRKHTDDREAIEAIERLLPSITCTTNDYPLYPYKLLFEMYTSAISSGASLECITCLENRIGKELDCATVEDLLALDLDVESLRRILKGYYGNFSDGSNPSGLVKVAELMEEYLLEVAKTREIDVKSFKLVAEMASTSHVGSYRCTDGIYRAVDTYLDKHKELSESEKEELCRVLDFQKMSSEACKHAAMNQRLPLRVLVQVLFASQLELRDNISKAAGEFCRNSNRGGNGSEVEDEEWYEEREEIEGCHERNCNTKKNKKVSLWKGMKRKLGCMRSRDYEALYNCNCQASKKKNKQEHCHPN